MNPRISIIIANYNSSDYTISCIKSILDKHDMSDKEIIIIDDGSDKKNQDIIDKWFQSQPYPNIEDEQLICYYLNENLGLGYAINRGNKKAKGKYLVKLDSDTTIIHKNFFDRLAKFLDEDLELGLVTCKTDNIGQHLQRMKIPDVFETNEEIEEFVDNLDEPDLKYHFDKESAYSGMMFIYRREDIEKFDIQYCTKTKFLVEDNIFYLDVLRKMKKKCAIAQKLFIKHTTNNSKREITNERILAKEIWEKEVL